MIWFGVVVMPISAACLLALKEYEAASGVWVAWSICAASIHIESEMKKARRGEKH